MVVPDANRQHVSYDGCLQAKREDSQNCVVYDTFCAQRYAHKCEHFLNLCLVRVRLVFVF